MNSIYLVFNMIRDTSANKGYNCGRQNKKFLVTHVGVV
jgi:hypothetical protein